MKFKISLHPAKSTLIQIKNNLNNEIHKIIDHAYWIDENFPLDFGVFQYPHNTDIFRKYCRKKIFLEIL